MTADDLLARRRALNDAAPPAGARCVLYVMSRDQRTKDNHALLAAQRHAVAGRLPLAVAFVVYAKSGYRAREHYAFMLDGLAAVESELARHDIPFVLRTADPAARPAAGQAADPAARPGAGPSTTLRALVEEARPAAVYVDFSPLRGPRRLRETLAEADCPVFEVDTHNVVPAWLASDKPEFAARTIRPKIHALLNRFLVEPPRLRKHPHRFGPGGAPPSEALDEIRAELLPNLPANGTVVAGRPGQLAGSRALRDFVAHRLAGYAEQRNDPTRDGVSGLSPYLHFGQLSALRVALAAHGRGPADAVDVLLEELIVRKELSDNFCLYEPRYDRLAGAPAWARKTLAAHAADAREYLYTDAQLERAETHDEAWNAAQRELTRTGKMHGYMRMYWAKKLLEWTPSAEHAIRLAIRLNDFYSIDGGDPNGYVGVLWSIAGLHDRPWGERPVFGQVRSMTEAGLRRKFRIEAYISRFPAD